MGHTHYYRQKIELPKTKFKQFAKLVKALVSTPDAQNVLAYECDEIGTPPQVDANAIRFNGKGNAGHETFLFSRVTPIENWMNEPVYPGFASGFCKTLEKPYDKYVIAVLILAKIIFEEDVKIKSDGGVSRWEEGRILAEQVYGKNIKLIVFGPDGLTLETTDPEEARRILEAITKQEKEEQEEATKARLKKEAEDKMDAEIEEMKKTSTQANLLS